jgi:S1-C subfamily serine protease
VIQTSTAFTSGASGGGLFDEDGRLVGILTYRLRGASGYYFSSAEGIAPERMMWARPGATWTKNFFTNWTKEK